MADNMLMVHIKSGRKTHHISGVRSVSNDGKNGLALHVNNVGIFFAKGVIVEVYASTLPFSNNTIPVLDFLNVDEKTRERLEEEWDKWMAKGGLRQ